MNTETLREELTTAYNRLCAMVTEQGNLEADIWQARVELQDAKAKILRDVDPKELGANEAQRNAQIELLVVIPRQRLGELEQGQMELRPRIEVARLRVEHLRAQLRLLEVEVGFQRAA